MRLIAQVERRGAFQRADLLCCVVLCNRVCILVYSTQTASYCTVVCCTVLYYDVLCCVVSCCVVLCHFLLFSVRYCHVLSCAVLFSSVMVSPACPVLCSTVCTES